MRKKILIGLITLIGMSLLFFAIYAQTKTNENNVTLYDYTENESTVQEIELPVFSLAKTTIYPGDYLAFFLNNINPSDEVILTQTLNKEQPPLFDYQNGKLGLFSVHYSTAPGDYPIHIKIIRDKGILLEQDHLITIKPKEFTTQHLYVSSSLSAKRDPQLLEQDSVYTNKAKSTTENKPLWQDSFIQPVTGRISTEYGLIRYINNVISGRHAGIDIAAPTGTPIKAANNGFINLARRQYVTGNTVIIDHGLGLYSSYAHLDKILVEQGDRVEKGQIIGKVGSTGFSTGPHLHWTVSIRTTFVNPWLFLEEDPLAWLNPAKY